MSTSTFTPDLTTALSLLSTAAILLSAYLASSHLLPANSSSKTRLLFIWHAFDAQIHLFLEGSYLYNCFFSYTTSPTYGLWPGGAGGFISAYTPPNVYFLGHKDRLYGSDYGANPMAALWREYAKADRRWGGASLEIVSLELLTVVIGAPMAAYVCYLLVKQRGSVWFWMVLLATGELYGGFITFAPEWLTGNPNLDASNFMYLWVYLVFFNMLWVFIPLWILYEAYQVLQTSVVPVALGAALREEESAKKDA